MNKLKRLNRSRKITGLPELAPWYYDRMFPRHPIRPELYPELNAINHKIWCALWEASRSFLERTGPSIPDWSNNSLIKIEISNRNEWLKVKELISDLRFSSVYAKDDNVICVLLLVDSNVDI